ncbi:MAG: NDP-sugar synthase [Candidatus Saganbacteria bacterium]|nr:NDP-sugar synthase [Candidatus Saganbacteria bacterium]
MRAIIIAGGLGTRLRPLTYALPKPVVPLVNIPFMVHQINLLRSHGIKEIILNLHYLADEIRVVLGDGSDYGVKLFYSIEKEALGTAGAVKNAEEFFDDDPMVVFNGDILTDVNISKLIEFHKKKKSTATLTLVEVEDPTPFGLVFLDKSGRIEKFIEKPHWQEATVRTINAGIYVIDPKVFAVVPKGKPHSFERELYPHLLREGSPMFGYVSHAYWLDIGNPKKYLEAHRAILREDVIANIPGHRSKEKVWWGEECEVSKEAHVHGPSIVANRCVIGPEVHLDFVVLGEEVRVSRRARIEQSVIWKGCKIGEGAVIKGSILANDCVVEEWAHIGEGTVLGAGSVVKKGNKLGI